MLRTLSRLAFAVAFFTYAFTAAAQLTLPSVAVGSALAARVSLSSVGGAPLGGVTVSLSVIGNCGTFQGDTTTTAVTDSSGAFSFVFTPNDVPGPCTIQGRNGNFVANAVTHVYRPADLDISHGASLVATRPVGAAQFDVQMTLTERGLPLFGVDATLGPPITITGGRPPTVLVGSATSDANGFVNFMVLPGPDVGVWDFPVRAGSATRPIRVQQTAAVTTAPLFPRLSRPVDDPLRDIHGAAAVSMSESAPQSCFLASASRALEQPGSSTPEATKDFPVGEIFIRVSGCPPGTSVVLTVNYGVSLPADGVMYYRGASGWQPLPSTVNGTSVSFTVPAIGDDAFLILGRPGHTQDLPKPAVFDMWWAGEAENGWGMSMAQSAAGNVFAAVYAYDDAGKPTWWVLPTVHWDYTRTTFEEQLYSTIGTPWHAYDTRYLITNRVGAARITMSGANGATFDYAINGITGRKAIQRQVFGPPDPRTVPNVNGMWWGGESQSGWGVSIVQHNATLFMVWFTYDDSMMPTWFVLPGGAWTSTSTYEGRIYRTRGSAWLGQPYDASKLVVTDVGPYKLSFNGGSAAMTYTIDGRAGSLTLVKQAPF